MAQKENLKPLKTLVFSMGLLLVGGTVILAGAVWNKVFAHKASASANCKGGEVNLKGHGVASDTSIDGQIVRVTFEKEDGKTEIVMLDLCSGTVTGTLTLVTDGDVVAE